MTTREEAQAANTERKTESLIARAYSALRDGKPWAVIRKADKDPMVLRVISVRLPIQRDIDRIGLSLIARLALVEQYEKDGHTVTFQEDANA